MAFVLRLKSGTASLMFLRLSRGLRRHNERAMCLLHHALGDGESPSLMTISFLIPHLHVPSCIHIPPTLVVRSYGYNRHWSSLSEDLRPPNLCRPWAFARTPT